MVTSDKLRGGPHSQFYTKRELLGGLAQDALDAIQGAEGRGGQSPRRLTFVDFSAGYNHFAPLLAVPSIAYDIDPPPSAKGVKKKDWFTVTRADIAAAFKNNNQTSTGPKALAIGLNPPFGKNCTLAKRFLIHAESLGADYLVLIVPPSALKAIAGQYTKVLRRTLPTSAFYTRDGTPFQFGTVFAVMARRKKELRSRSRSRPVVSDLFDLHHRSVSSTELEGSDMIVRRVGTNCGKDIAFQDARNVWHMVNYAGEWKQAAKLSMIDSSRTGLPFKFEGETFFKISFRKRLSGRKLRGLAMLIQQNADKIEPDRLLQKKGTR